ncbi:unnamed protein product [Eretmochelys imbricata]
MVVLLQYGCLRLVYLHSKGSWSDELDRLISLGYTFGSPIFIFNPLIYSLRNKELKEAIAKVLRRRTG